MRMISVFIDEGKNSTEAKYVKDEGTINAHIVTKYFIGTSG